ncbi:hypothetical protein GNF76_26120 [Pseudomonas sp. CCM 7893]|uniref:Uncharacterized protein n=1 Tax=Pseudomonas spelaei TaxID=1055469 RepID=A0A6I3WDI0_9PSED|nr:hypothetical protein [Pseudomonas spelaei]MUF07828.1 hypothetical protein [Pseudomonas spelaei]
MGVIDMSKVYDKADDFFSLNGNGFMKLSAQATLKVIAMAESRGLAISKVEGFILHRNTGECEARLDAIFDGQINPLPNMERIKNNERAKFSTEEDIASGHEIFIVTIVS